MAGPEHDVKSFQKRFGKTPGPLALLARLYARVFGWKITGGLPDDPKLIGIIAPHTSNWDVFMMYIMAYNHGITANWLAKNNLFRGPLKYVFRFLGAIPIDRSGRKNIVDQVVQIIQESDHLYLAIAPEGTRRKTDYWRTGFYWIAHKAGIRVIFMYIDYAKKETGFGPILEPSGDIYADFEKIKDFYRDVTPLNPEKRSEMALKPGQAHPPESENEKAPAPQQREQHP